MNEQNIFLLDGIGAFVSTLLVGGVLPLLDDWIGMPTPVLQRLAILSFLYCLYDFCCFRWANKQQTIWLCGVICANLLHSILTLAYMLQYASQLKTLGIIYFVIEILIVLVLVFYEGKVAKKIFSAAQLKKRTLK